MLSCHRTALAETFKASRARNRSTKPGTQGEGEKGEEMRKKDVVVVIDRLTGKSLGGFTPRKGETVEDVIRRLGKKFQDDRYRLRIVN